ncbi:uncharacterized protein CMU_015040 [Cryptosporidium muris RN66]|uniref:Uncharacterized protein n=1 Tax=Cryptosporidium muris (strain RN66) TaxID=441375 RepID=B6AF61_CRYMR|nr:uncharacterized protein CMU_015040 [Cryptosporidium muris RN66]EEA06828.1 hypothetical protein, conserved [Cryptosporidium muris RN66]|eukprot:XP_002141177.1 hypothetical protein [Cryptosporidium muris RN66]
MKNGHETEIAQVRLRHNLFSLYEKFMCSDILKIECRRDLTLLISPEKAIKDAEDGRLAIWLYEWYESKGRKVPLDKGVKYSHNEIPLEELEFLRFILGNLPDDYIMPQYFANLWYGYIFPNIKLDTSEEYLNTWIHIMRVMGKKYVKLFSQDTEGFINLTCQVIESQRNNRYNLVLVMIQICYRILSRFLQPRNSFNLIVKYLWKPLSTLFVERWSTQDNEILKKRILDIFRLTLSENHINHFLIILKNQAIGRRVDTKLESTKNYTFELYQCLFDNKGSSYHLIFHFMKWIHETRCHNYFKMENKTSNNGPNNSPEYLLFHLFISEVISNDNVFLRNTEYICQCFDFLVSNNIFIIRKGIDNNENIQYHTYQSLCKTLDYLVSKSLTNKYIWKCIELCIIVDPVECLPFLRSILATDDVYKLEASIEDDILEIVMSLITGSKFDNTSNQINYSVDICIARYIETFTNLRDFTTLLKEIAHILLSNEQTLTKDGSNLYIKRKLFLKKSCLESVIRDISLSSLPAQIPTILNDFLDTLMGMSIKEFEDEQYMEDKILNLTILSIWLGILLININFNEALTVPIMEVVLKINNVKNKNVISSEKKSSLDIIGDIVLTLGIIHICRKLLSWQVDEEPEIQQIIYKNLNILYNYRYGFNNKSSTCLDVLTLISLVNCSTLQEFNKYFDVKNLINCIFRYYKKLANDEKLALNYENSKFILSQYILGGFSIINTINPLIISDMLNSSSSKVSVFLMSTLEYIIFTQDSDNTKTYMEIPSLALPLLRITLELCKNILVNIIYKVNKETLKEVVKKKRRISPINRDKDILRLCLLLKFWNKKESIQFFVSSSWYLGNDIDKMAHIAFQLYWIFLNRVFWDLELNSEEKYGNFEWLNLIIHGVYSWIDDNTEISKKFTYYLQERLFNTNIEENNKLLLKYLQIIATNDEYFKFGTKKIMINILRLVICHELDEDDKIIHKLSYLLKHLNYLGWWWWVEQNGFFTIKCYDLENSNWYCQIYLCIEIFQVGHIGPQVFMENLKNQVSKSSIINNQSPLLYSLEVLQNTLFNIAKLGSNSLFQSNICIEHNLMLCKLFILLNPNILILDLEDNGGSNFEECKISSINNNILTKLKRAKSIIIITLDILHLIDNILLQAFVQGDLRKKLLMALDTFILLLSIIVEIPSQVVKLTKQQNKSENNTKETNCDLSTTFYNQAQEIFINVLNAGFVICKVNLRFGIFDNSEIEADKIIQWIKYISHCILEGSSINDTHFEDSVEFNRQMMLYDIFYKLTRNAPAKFTLDGLNCHYLSGVLWDYRTTVKTLQHNAVNNCNFFWEYLTGIDIFWNIFRHKSQVYRWLSPCLKDNIYVKLGNGGPSHRLYFYINAISWKIISILSILNLFPPLTVPFIIVRISNIVSVLYASSIKCHIMDKEHNSYTIAQVLPASHLVLSTSINVSRALNNLNYGEDAPKILSDISPYSWYCLFDCISISAYLPLYNLLNPLWDQSSRKYNFGKRVTSHIDVWISQFHLIEESLKSLLLLGDTINKTKHGDRPYEQHIKRISRLYPLIASQYTKNKVQRYSTSLIVDLIDYLHALEKKDVTDKLSGDYQLISNIIRKSCIQPILEIIDDHTKQSLYSILKEEQRSTFKYISRNLECN